MVSARIGRETVTYVSNIFKYYVAYKLVEEQREEQETDPGSPRRAEEVIETITHM